jgi:DNA-binding phage protein
MKHTDWLQAQLKDDSFAAHYLTQAAQELEPEVFIAALRHVVDARGGLAKVADVGKLSKASSSDSFIIESNLIKIFTPRSEV